jgi:hypothetical protein
MIITIIIADNYEGDGDDDGDDDVFWDYGKMFCCDAPAAAAAVDKDDADDDDDVHVYVDVYDEDSGNAAYILIPIFATMLI